MFDRTSIYGRTLRRLASLPYYAYHRWITHDPHHVALARWFLTGGNQLINHDLSSDSLVVDMGGYKGEFSDRILSWCTPQLHILEPVSAYSSALRTKYAGFPKVQVHPYGLSDKSRSAVIGLANDGSSEFKMAQCTEKVQLRDVKEFFEVVLGNRTVDLMSINIEGGEYAVLERMLEYNLQNRVKIIQVQFHRVVENPERKREIIIRRLTKTHDVLYSYPFVWEAYRIRPDNMCDNGDAFTTTVCEV